MSTFAEFLKARRAARGFAHHHEHMLQERAVGAAAAAEQLNASVIDALLRRQTLAAWYLDRAVTPILQPSEEHLREVFRSSAHPFRGQPFEEARTGLRRWLIAERMRVAESAFFQGARAHVRIIVSR
jgi:hypothetical protein